MKKRYPDTPVFDVEINNEDGSITVRRRLAVREGKDRWLVGSAYWSDKAVERCKSFSLAVRHEIVFARDQVATQEQVLREAERDAEAVTLAFAPLTTSTGTLAPDAALEAGTRTRMRTLIARNLQRRRESLEVARKVLLTLAAMVWEA